MAGYTRPAPRRNANPNVILVIFLVLFILISIGAGVWGYYGYEGQEELKKLALDEKRKANAANRAKDYYAYLTSEFKLIVGEKLDEEEKAIWKSDREEFMKEKGGRFDDGKNRAEYKDLIEKLQKDLKWDDTVQEPANPYTLTWETRIKTLEDEKKKLRSDVVDRVKEIESLTTRLRDTNKAYKDSNDDMFAKIKNNATASLAAANRRTTEMIESFNRNGELLNLLRDEKDKHKEIAFEWFREKNKLEERLQESSIVIAKLNEKLKEGGGGQPQFAKRGLTEPQPLALDVSMGKPLWDTPVGIVTRIIDARRIEIAFFDGDRVQERVVRQLTFNVFDPVDGKTRRAAGSLKATVEINAVLERGAEAQITANFVGGKDNPLREGDLLFNLTWGTHVAIIGTVNLFADAVSRTETLAERGRNLEKYISRLEERGVIVDAYVDLNTGEILGKYKKIEPEKTRILIRGFDLPELGRLPKREDVKDPEDPVTKHLLDLRDKMDGMYKESVARGLLVISPENFANVAGYRKIGGYAPNERAFVPSVPGVK